MLVNLNSLYIFLIIFSVTAQKILDFYDLLSVDYPQNDLRSKFLNEKKQNNVTSRRIQLLDKYLNDSVDIDSIIHIDVKKLNKNDTRDMKIMENDFKNLITMNGLTYIYKRDMHWRTWRNVQFSDGPKMIYYKCESSVNCSNCKMGSYWNIVDEVPPCPYEIFSITADNRLCVVNLTQLPYIENYYNKCLNNISYGDLMSTCNNPMETTWMITKRIGLGDNFYPKTLCGDSWICNIITFYKISSDNISFRIVNASNHIIYSKVMKTGRKKYVCINDCGIYDPTSKSVTETAADKPFSVNLIKKNKRENAPTLFYGSKPLNITLPNAWKHKKPTRFNINKKGNRTKGNRTITCIKLNQEYNDKLNNV